MRLFDVEEIPEVPIFREPRRAQAARGISLDARFANDYPADWHRCGGCNGSGWGIVAGDRRIVPFVNENGQKRGDCSRCDAMGSLKAMVRLRAGHRCVRCKHPYVPKGDAVMLGVEPTPYHWSPCDGLCAHRGPLRWRSGVSDDWKTVADTVSTAREWIVGSETDLPAYAVEAEWRILTVHHLDGDKANCRWWNLAALCQRCHLEIQAKVVMERVYPHEHSEWFKPFVAGYYASVYLNESLERHEVMERMDELLALERIA